MKEDEQRCMVSLLNGACPLTDVFRGLSRDRRRHLKSKWVHNYLIAKSRYWVDCWELTQKGKQIALAASRLQEPNLNTSSGG